MYDKAVSPSHYKKGNIECIEAIEDLKFGYHDGNAMKYLWRYRDKGDPGENLLKCVWYLSRLLQRLGVTPDRIVQTVHAATMPKNPSKR